MAVNSEMGCSPRISDCGGIPTLRFSEAEHHVLETASGLLTTSPKILYLMSFIVRMRYCPETDSCQVIIQPHYSPADVHDEENGGDIVSPLLHEIRVAIGEKISAKACAYISASSSLDEDNLTDLFILYFFVSGEGEKGNQRISVSGVYQMNLALRTFVPEMEEIAIDALERCLSIVREGPEIS